MAYNFFPWIDDAKVPNNLNLNNGTDFVSNEEREEGFKPNTIARSGSANSGLRQANLVVAALMKVASGASLSPSSPAPLNLDLTSKIDDVAIAIKELGSNLLVRFEMASNRTNVASGDSLSTILGKIGKYFNDLQSFAFNSIQTSQSTSLNAPTTKLLMESSFAKVYRSIASVSSSITASSTISAIFTAMSNNSYLIANTSGYTDSSLQPDQETSGILEIIKLDNNNGLTRFTVYKSSSLTVSYYSSFTTSGGFSSWQKTVDSSDVTSLHTEIDSFVKSNDIVGTEGLTFTYDDTNGTAVCTGGSVSGSVVISSYVKNDGKWYKVTKIGSKAFQNNTNITSIKFPLTLENIGDYAFDGCSNLKSISNIGNVGNLTVIGSHAFRGIISGGNLEFRQDRLEIGSYAFDGSSIKTIKFFTKYLVLKSYCFINCVSLTEVGFYVGYVDASSANSPFNGCTSLTTIKAVCDEIYGLDFNSCTSLTNVRFECNRLYQPEFRYCTSLKEVIFPENIYWSIYKGQKMFYGTDGVKAVFLMDGNEPFSSDHENRIKEGATNLTIEYRYRVVNKKYIHSVTLTPKNNTDSRFGGVIKIIDEDSSGITDLSRFSNISEAQILSVSGYVWEDSSNGYPVTKYAKPAGLKFISIYYASSLPVASEIGLALISNSTSNYDFSDIVYEL